MESKENNSANAPSHLGAILAIYLIGLAVGGLYVGAVSPVRTVIQTDFQIDDSTGIWMINIYTLFYAALIPIIGKLADNHGRKPVLIACLVLFACGALLCGASATVGGFGLLLVGRVIQAVGACGMIPMANAEVGTVFPPEKRGLALGMTAAVAGVSNVLGAAAGSGILALVGNANWPMLFFVSVPLCIALAVAAIIFLPNRATEKTARLDMAGSVLMVLFVLGLLLSLKSLDFFNLPASACTQEVLLPAVLAIVALVAFVAVEHRVADPVFHLEYLGNRPIVVTMIVSFFIGCVIISMTLVPQFAEFVTGGQEGSGGFYVLFIGVLSMAGPPLGGKLIDRLGPKPVLVGGLVVQTAGYVFLAAVAATTSSPVALAVGLSIVGLGMGFSMGAPTNYMILENTSDSESSSAIATIALVRQIGTSLAPALLVGFITVDSSLAGYQHMLLCVVVFSVLALVALVFYKSPRK